MRIFVFECYGYMYVHTYMCEMNVYLHTTVVTILLTFNNSN